MCAALGGLQGFDVTGGTEVSALVGDALADLASVSPVHALTRAQSVAPGLPEIAVRTVDVATEFESWANDDDERLTAVGRIGVDRFRKRSENAEGAEEDDDTEWG